MFTAGFKYNILKNVKNTTLFRNYLHNIDLTKNIYKH